VKRHYHPIQKDAATFLRTSRETGGELTAALLEVDPGGGNALHIHRRFDEHFTGVAGVTRVEVRGQVHALAPGESAVAPRNTPHRWWNAGNEPAHVRIELRPGDTRFEEFIQIFYGIGADGGSDARGVPRNLIHAGFALVHGDITPAGRQRALMPVLHACYWIARMTGIGERLRQRYCELR
jgi:quercetin dioxygenase-like cupin family protein